MAFSLSLFSSACFPTPARPIIDIPNQRAAVRHSALRLVALTALSPLQTTSLLAIASSTFTNELVTSTGSSFFVVTTSQLTPPRILESSGTWLWVYFISILDSHVDYPSTLHYIQHHHNAVLTTYWLRPNGQKCTCACIVSSKWLRNKSVPRVRLEC